MAVYASKITFTAKLCDVLSRTSVVPLTFSSPYTNIGGWRLRQGLPAKGVEYGPLTDLPDWSYADGRPAPITQGCKKRIKLHKSYCEQIIKLTKEVDECFELNEQKAAMEEEKRQNVIKNRLKTKGRPLA